MELLEPAFADGLPKPNEQQKLKKCLERVYVYLGFSILRGFGMLSITKYWFVNFLNSGGATQCLLLA